MLKPPKGQLDHQGLWAFFFGIDYNFFLLFLEVWFQNSFQFLNVLKYLKKKMFLGSLRSFLKCACMCARLLQSVQLFVTPWTAAHQAPLSMGFSRQEY